MHKLAASPPEEGTWALTITKSIPCLNNCRFDTLLQSLLVQSDARGLSLSLPSWSAQNVFLSPHSLEEKKKQPLPKTLHISPARLCEFSSLPTICKTNIQFPSPFTNTTSHHYTLLIGAEGSNAGSSTGSNFIKL